MVIQKHGFGYTRPAQYANLAALTKNGACCTRMDIHGQARPLFQCCLVTKQSFPFSFCHLVYVLNYSWVFGGIWQMLKRALPETARARVSFPSSLDEIQEHFDPEELSTGKNLSPCMCVGTIVTIVSWRLDGQWRYDPQFPYQKCHATRAPSL